MFPSIFHLLLVLYPEEFDLYRSDSLLIGEDNVNVDEPHMTPLFFGSDAIVLEILELVPAAYYSAVRGESFPHLYGDDYEDYFSIREKYMFYKFEELFHHIHPKQVAPLLLQEVKIGYFRAYHFYIWLDETYFIAIIEFVGLSGVVAKADYYDAELYKYLLKEGYLVPGTWYYKYLLIYGYVKEETKTIEKDAQTTETTEKDALATEAENKAISSSPEDISMIEPSEKKDPKDQQDKNNS